MSAVPESLPPTYADVNRDVERTLLLSESMYVALPREHPLAKSKRVPLAKLADEAWLRGVGSSSCGEVIVQACRDAGFEPRIAFESDEYQVLDKDVRQIVIEPSRVRVADDQDLLPLGTESSLASNVRLDRPETPRRPHVRQT